jgi:hypothetical protein
MSLIKSYTNALQLTGTVTDLATEIDRTIMAFADADVVSVAVTPVIHSPVGGAAVTGGVRVTIVWRVP